MGKKCSEVRGKVDDIRIQLGGLSYDFGVPFEDYTVDFNEKDVDYCIIGIQAGDYDFFVLGDSILRSYLSIYDFEASRVGLALHKYSKATIAPHQKPSNFAIQALMISFAVLSLMCGLYYLYHIRVSKSKEQLTRGLEEQERREQQNSLLQPVQS